MLMCCIFYLPLSTMSIVIGRKRRLKLKVRFRSAPKFKSDAAIRRPHCLPPGDGSNWVSKCCPNISQAVALWGRTVHTKLSTVAFCSRVPFEPCGKFEIWVVVSKISDRESRNFRKSPSENLYILPTKKVHWALVFARKKHNRTFSDRSIRISSNLWV